MFCQSLARNQKARPDLQLCRGGNQGCLRILIQCTVEPNFSKNWFDNEL